MSKSKIARQLNIDRKTVNKYLKRHTPKTTRNRLSYLDEHREYIFEVLNDKYQFFSYIDHLFKYLKREKGIRCYMYLSIEKWSTISVEK